MDRIEIDFGQFRESYKIKQTLNVPWIILGFFGDEVMFFSEVAEMDVMDQIELDFEKSGEQKVFLKQYKIVCHF